MGIKISACIITYNEENNIKDCIESVLPFADEIVIVDSLSTDKTVEIARRYTDKIYSIPFQGYVAQKNIAIDKASYDWIFALDADERASKKLQEELLRIKNEGPKADGYFVRRLTCYIYKWIRHSDWYPDYKIRFFNRNKGRWVGVDPHDYVDVDGKVEKIKADLLHYSFNSIEDHINTIQKFTTIGAKELYKKGKKITILGMIGHSFFIFFKMFILKRGFLDGPIGFIIAVLSSFHVFSKYAKLYVMNKKEKKGKRCRPIL